MPRTRSLIASWLLLSLLIAYDAHAKPTPEQKCQAGKNIAAGKLAACLQTAEAKHASTGDTEKYASAKLNCSYKFTARWLKLEAAASRAGVACPDAPLDQDALAASIRGCVGSVATALSGGGLPNCSALLDVCADSLSEAQEAHAACEAILDSTQLDLAGCQTALAACAAPTPSPTAVLPDPTPSPAATPLPRFVDNGDGTVTDNDTGLMWEKKTNLDAVENAADPHDADNRYNWRASGQAANGTIFTVFLPALNAGAGFAGYTDWRLPSSDELESILLQPYPCQTSPCINAIFGPTIGANYSGGYNSYYWSATIPSGYGCCNAAEYVRFDNGDTEVLDTGLAYFVRAVRSQ